MILSEYDCVDALWIDSVRAAMIMGYEFESRIGNCKELIGQSLVLTDIRNNFVTNRLRRLSPEYAAGELFWYLSLDRRGDAILAYAPSYKNFLDDGIANGSYGWRWLMNPGFNRAAQQHQDTVLDNQLSLAFKMLKQDPNTRQCIVTMWDSEDLIDAYKKTYKDIPCTLSMQFLLRENKLHCIVNMRSNDIWLGLPYDIFCFSTIQRIMADALEVEYGTYTHNVGSLHIYEKHYSNVSEPLSIYSRIDDTFKEPYSIDTVIAEALLKGCSQVSTQEKLLRNKEIDSYHHMLTQTYIDDLLYCVAHKFTDYDYSERILNRQLANNLKEKE